MNSRRLYNFRCIPVNKRNLLMPFKSLEQSTFINSVSHRGPCFLGYILLDEHSNFKKQILKIWFKIYAMWNLCTVIKFNIAFLNVQHVTALNYWLHSAHLYITNSQFSCPKSKQPWYIQPYGLKVQNHFTHLIKPCPSYISSLVHSAPHRKSTLCCRKQQIKLTRILLAYLEWEEGIKRPEVIFRAKPNNYIQS